MARRINITRSRGVPLNDLYEQLLAEAQDGAGYMDYPTESLNIYNNQAGIPGMSADYESMLAAAQNGAGFNDSYTIASAAKPAAASVNPATTAGAVGAGAGIKGWFGNHFGQGKALINKNLNIPNLHQMGSNLRATSLWQGGPTVATAANTISGIYQGGKAVKGLYENSTKGSDLESLKDDISLQIASNPMYTNALDASDERMLRQMNNGTLTNGVGNAAGGAIKGIPQAALAALIGGITGGPVGAIIGGGGSLLNSGIEGYGQGLDRANAKLQGLYGKLRDANDEYRSMKRPSGLRRAGLQSRYYNQLY